MVPCQGMRTEIFLNTIRLVLCTFKQLKVTNTKFYLGFYETYLRALTHKPVPVGGTHTG